MRHSLVGPGQGESLGAMLCHVQLDPEMCSPLSLEQLSLLCIVGELEHLTIAVAVLPPPSPLSQPSLKLLSSNRYKL